MAKILGYWELDRNENMDAYMKAMGIGYFLRKIAQSIKSYEEIKQDGDNWEILISSTFKSGSHKFKLDEEFEEDTLDGRRVKTKFSLEDDKLVATQLATKEGEQDAMITRAIGDTDDTLVITMKATKKDVTAIRYYKRCSK